MRKAFTLVELLVVISIMAILTTVTVAQFRTARKKASDVARKGDLNAVTKALQMYFADYGQMPEMSSPNGGLIMVGSDEIDWGEEFKDASGYVYMKVLPKENKLIDSPYCYKTDSNRKYYALFAMLENTADKECISGATYRCGNSTSPYCFAYVSPNISLDSDGDFK